MKNPQILNDPPVLLKELKKKSERNWIKNGEERALELFHEMSKRVPAYKDFLAKNNVNPDSIKTIEDFKQLPTVDKNNYLRQYKLSDLCWNGELKEESWVISTTSGSTGEPFYFPRTNEQDWQYAATAEMYLLNNFNIDKKSTLYIDGFAMGAWIGGLFTYQAIKHVANRGKYKLSIITPGIFKKEIIKAVRNLGHNYDQVIIGGYPPFVKATIDEGIEEGLDWKEYKLGFIFSAEGFNESFRDYVIEATGLTDSYRDTLNHYGTVDLGTMSHETPIAILIRRLALKHKSLFKTIFKDVYKLPTLTQYMPEMFYFEDINGHLLCSAFSGLPLVRYDLKDNGGVFTWRDIQKQFESEGIDLLKEAKQAGIEDTIMNLPFVYVYERADFVVKLYGANIYPETIRKALQHTDLTESVTGRFTMMIQFDKRHNQFLELNVELKHMVKKSNELKRDIQEIIVHRLLKENSEYKSNYKEAPQRQMPEIVLWEYENPLYFQSGVKQKWVKK